MVSNFGFGRPQVPCYLSECMAFKCYYCHVFVMYSFNTWMKLSAECWSQSSWQVTLSSKFPFLNLLQREELLIHVLPDQPSELVHTLMMRFLKQSVVGKRLLSLDVNNTDNRLNHDREMEIGESTSKTLKKLIQEQKKEP